MAKRATAGNQAAFTYDFGIMISQSTINKVAKLTGVTLTLASAFYALQTTADKYIETLRKNTVRFGGVISSMRALQQAQDRLIKGQTFFNVDDQMEGMNRLMAAGVNVKKNFDFINKAAHATGKSFSDFSSAIADGIAGNMGSLVDMGLITQRATRMFEKYEGNTIMRQQAILGFVKSHKGLLNAVKGDFEVVQDHMRRIKETWASFLQSVVGKPNDKGSLYGTVVQAVKAIADSFARNAAAMKEYGIGIGVTLTWVVKQVGHVIMWLAKQAKKATNMLLGDSSTFVERMRSLVVWLEFWKLKVVSFFKQYGNEIKTVLKLVVAYKLLKLAFVIGNVAIASVIAYKRALTGIFLLQSRYRRATGASWLMSMAAWMPKWFRGFWIMMGKKAADFAVFFRGALIAASRGGLSGIGRYFSAALPWVTKLLRPIKLLFSILRNLPAILGAIFTGARSIGSILAAVNPVGWIILAITLLTTLYAKVKSFRQFINNLFRFLFGLVKLLWNSINWLYVQIRIGATLAWRWLSNNLFKPIGNFFSSVGGWISNMWSKFKDSTVGKWLDKWVIKPLKDLFGFIGDIWKSMMDGMGWLVKWVKGANNSVAASADAAAAEYGFKSYSIGDNKNPNGTVPVITPVDGNNNPVTANPAGNPITDSKNYNDNTVTSEDSTNMKFEKGAVQIIVQKGMDIDENKLAQKVRAIIEDMQRTSKKRGGLV